MLGEEELGASFLITLKHRSVTPDLVDGASRCLADMLEPMEPLRASSTDSAYNSVGLVSTTSKDRPLTAEEGATPKNDTFHDRDNRTQGPAGGVSFSMALPEDAHWLSEVQCYVRSNCCEFFVAGENDVKGASPSSSRRCNNNNNNGANGCPSSSGGGQGGGGRRGRISVGRVGIRCVFCRDLPPSARAAQAASFPSQISGVYGAIVMMQCRHFGNCPAMPEAVRSTLERIRGTRNTTPPPGSLPGEVGGGVSPSPPSSLLSTLLLPSSSSPMTSSSTNGTTASAPGRQQYWAESARKLGLVDSPDGIRFAPWEDEQRREGGEGAVVTVATTTSFQPIIEAPVSSLGSSSSSDAQAVVAATTATAAPSAKTKKKGGAPLVTPDMSSSAVPPESLLEVPDLSLPSSLSSLMGDTVLVSAEDKDLVPDYLFLAMAQMKPCALAESDRVGCYKERTLGFVGMCCKHCGGQPGFGKYFPATVRSLAQTTTSQTIIKHIAVKCRLCPPEVRNAVLALQQNCHDRGCNYSRGPASANDGRPKYGSRKVFFQRVWGRLHGEDVPEIPDFEAQQQAQQAQLMAAAQRHHRMQRTDPSSSASSSSTAGPAPTVSAGTVAKKRARPPPRPEEQQHSDGQQEGANIVTPPESDAASSIQGDHEDEDEGSVNTGGAGDVAPFPAADVHVSEEEDESTSSSSSSEEEQDQGPEDEEDRDGAVVGVLLTDDRNRRVTVRAGGERVVVFGGGGRGGLSSSSRRRRKQKNPNNHKRKVNAVANDGSGNKNYSSKKRARQVSE